MMKNLYSKRGSNLSRAPTINSYLNATPHPLRQAGGVLFNPEYILHSKLPLVTVITVVLNRKDTLVQAIESVLVQTYPNIEYIIIDGASTDGTLEIIKQFEHKISCWISEPDLGISDALNKAISLSQGNIISWLPSDDWMDSDFIEIAVQGLLKSNADFVFGNMRFYKGNDFLNEAKGDKDYHTKIHYTQPNLLWASMVVQKECFEKAGLFDLRYKIVCDYEWSLRLHLQGGKGVYVNRLIANSRIGGISNSNNLMRNYELLKVFKQYESLTFGTAILQLYTLIPSPLIRIMKLIFPKVIFRELKRLLSPP